MEINGITFNLNYIKGYSLADIGNGIVNLFRLNIEFPDDTEIIKVYKTIDKAKEVFSCKLQGKRAHKARKLIKELVDCEQND